MKIIKGHFNPLKALLQGFFVNLTNIKGTVFFLALIPLFIDLNSSKAINLHHIYLDINCNRFDSNGWICNSCSAIKGFTSDPKKILWQNRLTGSTSNPCWIDYGHHLTLNNYENLSFSLHSKDLDSTRQFYGELLGCQEGRSSDTWVDFNFFGHQLSLHVGEVSPKKQDKLQSG